MTHSSLRATEESGQWPGHPWVHNQACPKSQDNPSSWSHEDWPSYPLPAYTQTRFWDIIPLSPCSVLKHSTQPLNHSVSIHMLILFLQIMRYSSKHETAHVERIIASLLICSMICSTQTSREVLRVWLCKNIHSFLLLENNSQVAVPINKISSIELFLLKQGSQIKIGSATNIHDLQQEINSKILALGYVPIFY
jgi:hypothetical protein